MNSTYKYNGSSISRFCTQVIESGWLLAIALTPLFFNIYSSRVFEPDKLTLLRSIAIVMIVAWAVKLVDTGGYRHLSIDRVTKVPLSKPLIALVIVYILSTLFSVTPRVSLLGSYQRLQGLYTTLSYIVIFAMMVANLRNQEQLDRIITTAIIVSIPISLYGLLQHYRLDPLPWGADVSRRIASNMGNAIFVSAYVIMVTPLVIYRIIDSFIAILRRDILQLADMIRATIYIFVLLLHVLVILFSQSRGPMIGFIAGIFAFALILLVQIRDRSQSTDSRASFSSMLQTIGSIIAANIIGYVAVYGGLTLLLRNGIYEISASASTLSLGISQAEYSNSFASAAGLFGSIGFGLAALLLMIAVRKGWQWLWVGLILQAGLIAGFLILFNVPDSPISDWRHLPYIGRFGSALDLETNTGKVRTYIWQGAVEMITPHEPIEFPDGDYDKVNIARPLIGHGPESMYVAYNRFYPPELAHVEKRNASPDRSHNETFDAFVISGLAGFVAWQVLYAALFYRAFKWLGIIQRKSDIWLLAAIVYGSAVIVSLGFWSWQGLEFVGVAFPFGELFGVMLYLVVYAAFGTKPKHRIGFDHAIPLIAILAAVIAHFAEIHFGIAIAATRTYFFAYAAVAVFLGSKLTSEAKERIGASSAPVDLMPSPPTKGRRKIRVDKRRKPRSYSSGTNAILPLLASAIIMGLIIGTLGFEFISNPQRPAQSDTHTAFDILIDSLTTNPKNDFNRSHAVLGLFMLTALTGCGLVISESVSSGDHPKSSVTAMSSIGLYFLVAVVVGLVFMIYMANQLQFLSTGAGATTENSLVERLTRSSNATASILSTYYLYAFSALLIVAWTIGKRVRSTRSKSSSQALIVALVLVVAAIILIRTTNLRPIQADMVYKQADAWEKRASQLKNTDYLDIAISGYQHAIDLAPQEDYYYLFLGRAMLERANLNSDPALREIEYADAYDVLLQAQELNPLNTDHSANLARLQTRWADYSTDPAIKAEHTSIADWHYFQANLLSPNNAVILNEWSRLAAYVANDCNAALDRADRSLLVDPKYAATYETKGGIALACAEGAPSSERQSYLAAAEDTFHEWLDLSPCNLQAVSALAYAQGIAGNKDGAIETNLKGLDCTDSTAFSDRFSLLRNLSVLYHETGVPDQAQTYADLSAFAAQNNPSRLIDAAKLQMQLSTPGSAVNTIARILDLPSASWDVLRDTASMLAQTGEIDLAVEAASRSLAIAPPEQEASIQSFLSSLIDQSNQSQGQ